MADVVNSVMHNMYDMGIISFERDDHTAEIITSDNCYKIIIKRKESGFFLNGETRFSCIITVYDNTMNNEVVELSGSEKDIAILLDVYGNYLNMRQDIQTPPFPPLTDGTFMFLQFIAPGIIRQTTSSGKQIELMEDLGITKIAILQYNPLTEQVVQRCILTFEEYDLERFMNTLYFILLIDTNYAESIYDDGVNKLLQ